MEHPQELTAARSMRTAIEAVLATDGPCGIPGMEEFPAGQCDNASEFLAAYLADLGMGPSLLTAGERPPPKGAPPHEQTRGHAWLERGGVIIDITADQFDEGQPPVLVVEGRSTWHDAFTSNRWQHEVGTLDFERHGDGPALQRFYTALRAHLPHIP